MKLSGSDRNLSTGRYIKLPGAGITLLDGLIIELQFLRKPGVFRLQEERETAYYWIGWLSFGDSGGMGEIRQKKRLEL